MTVFCVRYHILDQLSGRFLNNYFLST